MKGCLMLRKRYVCFIDRQKAFDCTDWTKLPKMLRYIGVNWREHQLIHNLYMGHRVKLLLNQEETDSVEIGRGVREGYCMSTIFLKLYVEYLMKEALAEFGDLKIGGRTIIRSDLLMIQRL